MENSFRNAALKIGVFVVGKCTVKTWLHRTDMSHTWSEQLIRTPLETEQIPQSLRANVPFCLPESRWSLWPKIPVNIFLSTVSFETCSVLDHSFFFSFSFLMIFSAQKSPKKLQLIKKDVLNMLFTSSPPHPSSPLAIISHNSLLVITTMTFEISARSRRCFPWSVSFLDFFLAFCSKVFQKASLSLMKEQVSRLGKSAVVQYVTVFRLILAKRVKHWSRAWDGKASYCELWCGVGSDKSLASKSSL